MFLFGKFLSFALELCKRAYYAETCIAWFYDIVDITIFCSLVWIGKQTVVFSLFFCNERCGIFSLLCLFCIKDFCRTSCTHYGNLGTGPCIVHVGTQLLAGHYDM